MSHNLDITNGQASFASANTAAWHQLGTVLPGTFTAEQALAEANLGGWNVRKLPMMAEVAEGLTIPVPGRYAVVRNNPVIAGQVDVLGDLGESYRVLQNEALVDLLDTLVDESGAAFETAGAINGGKQVFVSMKMPGHIKVGGVDPVDQYIAAMTSHDGSMATTIMVTPVRIVCQNTMNMAFQNKSNLFRVKHTTGADKLLVKQAREAISFTDSYLDRFIGEAQQLADTSMTSGQFLDIISKEFGAADDAPGHVQTKAEAKLDELHSLYVEADTQAGIRDTAWAGLNALTEWADHHSPVRAKDEDEAATIRSRKAITDPAFKNKALNMMREFAGIGA